MWRETKTSNHMRYDRERGGGRDKGRERGGGREGEKEVEAERGRKRWRERHRERGGWRERGRKIEKERKCVCVSEWSCLLYSLTCEIMDGFSHDSEIDG